ncbi:hypothetical protein PCASD_09961 [Puccinia coronata f. sp. avenae]|uniref:Uncharacterized protein n=1 Tax=Puccinia coronata f. sp. avenae TaxID=200324 RepID=A0A2N5UUW4_9BASI|nr:hypothetical protein PCASD_09961 [Puccinia coronata f. sp. avenae]
MSDPTKKQTSNNQPSPSNSNARSGSTSPSIPNQTGKRTKERINEQIGVLKDALAIPFLASPPPSTHDRQTTSATSQPSIPIATHPTMTQHLHAQHPPFHYTPSPYTALTANTTH